MTLNPLLWKMSIKEARACKFPTAGVYWVVLSGVTIGRLCGSDSFGILYIGKKKATDRISELAESFEGNWIGSRTPDHDAGGEYHRGGAGKLYDVSQLQIWYHEIVTPFLVDTLKCDETYYEDGLLVTYRNMLGEYPPLNICPPRWKCYEGKRRRFGHQSIGLPKGQWATGRGLDFGLPHYAPQKLYEMRLNLNELG